MSTTICDCTRQQNAAMEADTGWIFWSTRLLLIIPKMRVIVAQEVKKHDVISMQSVVAEIDGDHLADGWNGVHTNEPRAICAKKKVRKTTKKTEEECNITIKM